MPLIPFLVAGAIADYAAALRDAELARDLGYLCSAAGPCGV